MLLLIVTACGDIEVRYFTKINLDGTIFKRVTAVGDSSAIYNKPFSFDTSLGWDITYKKEITKSVEDTLYYAIAEQTFESIDALNRVMHSNKDTALTENVHVNLNSKFRWFFTFHEYEEIFIQRFPYKHLKVEDFLSAEEQAYFFNDDTTVIIGMSENEVEEFDKQGETKWVDFLMSSINIEYIRLVEQYASSHNYDIPDEHFSKKMAEVFQVAIEDGPELPMICQISDSLLSSSWISKAYEEGYFENFERQLNDEIVIISGRKYVVEVDVPGLIYYSNADFIDEGVVKWQFKAGSFSYKDFTAEVSYRTTNWWAIIITLLIITSSIIYTLYFSRKKKFH